MDLIRINDFTSDIPLFMLMNENDKIIKFKHMNLIYNNYKGPKHKLLINLGHNEPRDSILPSIL